VADSLTSARRVAFDASQLTSDGGLVWLAQADDQLGLSTALAAQIREWRRGPVRHSLARLVRQRILQIACRSPADRLRR
jgi:Transposase DDE domain group 1